MHVRAVRIRRGALPGGSDDGPWHTHARLAGDIYRAEPARLRRSPCGPLRGQGRPGVARLPGAQRRLAAAVGADEPGDAAVPISLGPYITMVRTMRKEARHGVALPWVVHYGGQVRRAADGREHHLGIGTHGAAWATGSTRVAGRGVTPTALAMAIDHCFTVVGLHRVEATIRPENQASRRVVEKLGFREEGLRRRCLHVDGAWRDHMCYALTAEDAARGGVLARWRRHAVGVSGSAAPRAEPTGRQRASGHQRRYLATHRAACSSIAQPALTVRHVTRCTRVPAWRLLGTARFAATTGARGLVEQRDPVSGDRRHLGRIPGPGLAAPSAGLRNAGEQPGRAGGRSPLRPTSPTEDLAEAEEDADGRGERARSRRPRRPTADGPGHPRPSGGSASCRPGGACW